MAKVRGFARSWQFPSSGWIIRSFSLPDDDRSSVGKSGRQRFFVNLKVTRTGQKPPVLGRARQPLNDRAERYCVVGAGPSGLTVAKNFRQAGIACDVIERADEVGGNWYYGQRASSVYQSTHLISSKRLTEFTDFPMPAEYPEYPSHAQAWEYLRTYARHFGLYDGIELGRAVEWIEPAADGWQVRLSDGEVRQYAGVVIANGHHWDPRLPELPGHFSGLALHSSAYKTPEVLRGKRVLVMGAGNSGCDIAVEAAQNAAATFHSLRRGYHYLPKFLFGRPSDQCGERLLRWRLPLGVRRLIASRATRIALGRPQAFGLPAADHKLFETHPIINSQMLYYVGHGKIRVKPDVQSLEGDRVRFVDGTLESIDVIVYATGFRITIPFIDRQHLNWQGDRPDLFLSAFHPQYDNLLVDGLIQPDSGLWGLVDRQAQLMARFIGAKRHAPRKAEEFRRLKQAAGGRPGGPIHYVGSPRHAIEVEHFSYRRRVEKLIRRFD
jgi:cation diffusion facilitator CzcD-associated flavoprotein CzcO